MTLLSVTFGLAAALFLAATAFLACVRMEKGRGRTLLFSAFLICGVWRMGVEMLPEPELIRTAAESGQPVQVRGRIRDIGKKEKTDGTMYTLTLDDSRMDGTVKAGRVLVYIREGDFGDVIPDELNPGQVVWVKGSISKEEGPRNPGEFDYGMYYRSLSIRARVFGEGIGLLDRRESPCLTWLYRLRLHAGRILDLTAEPEDAGVYKAAVLGKKGDLDAELRDLYQKNGIAHLLAISGLHVAVIGAGIYGLLRWLGLGFGPAGAAAGVILTGYGFLTGSPASVVRAVIMLLCVFLAAYIGRSYDLVSAACLACMVLLAKSPYLVTQGGFQLSFGAVFSIGVLSETLISAMKPEHGWQRTVITSLSIQLGTYPIILYHFYQYPVFGIFLNFLVIPLMTFVIYSGLGGILLGSVSLAAGTVAVGAGHYILAGYRVLCVWCSKLPCYTLIAGRPEIWQVLIYYGVLLSLIYRRNSDKMIRWRQLLAVTALCFCLLLHIPVRGLEVTFLDVGQGDGCFLEMRGCRVLVDGGSSSEKELGKESLEPFLKSRGVGKIDYAIVSHGDADHISGLVYLLESVPDISISCLVLPCLSIGDEAYNRLKELAALRGTEVVLMAEGDRLEKGKLMLTCLYPGLSDPAADRNEQSLVVKADYGEFHLLLTGDMSSEGEERLIQRMDRELAGELAEVQVLKAAHHGSKTSSSQEFLDAVSPRWAVVSYGENNRYGHPAPEVMERLEKQSCEIWETAKSGAVMLHTDGKQIWWKCEAAKIP